MKKVIAWWSAGVTSAVACKLAIEKYGLDNVDIFYFEIDSAHSDNKRFKEACEKWYGKEIKIRRSAKFNDQFEVIKKIRYVNGPSGARCTQELKKEVRYAVEKEFPDFDAQIFGFESQRKEINRALRFLEQYPYAKGEFPLIEAGMDKPACLYYLEKAGIGRPEMYLLGYPNNNCRGCVKGGQGYWNKIRIDFPDIFDKMVGLEREVGASCLKQQIPDHTAETPKNKKTVKLFLDELNPTAGRDLKIIMPDCGSFCDLELTEIEHEMLDEVEANGQQILGLYTELIG